MQHMRRYSVEAGGMSHRVIKSSTAEVNPRNDRKEQTFSSPLVTALEMSAKLRADNAPRSSTEYIV